VRDRTLLVGEPESGLEVLDPPGSMTNPSDHIDTTRESEHRAVVDLALMMADEDAREGDLAAALRALRAAEHLDGRLPPDYAAKGARWASEHAVLAHR
jgi:hypothetical protein